MSRARTVLLFLAVTLIFGTAFPAVKAGLAFFPPLVFVAVSTGGVPIGRAVDRAWIRARGHRARITAVALAVAAVPFALATAATLTALLPPTVELVVGSAVTTAALATGTAAFVAIAASIEGASTESATTDRVTPTTSRQL
jgi:drug/metabolite transporter (DMT)-like permease